MEKKTIIRFGKRDDLAFLVHIYNQAIRTGICTGDLDEFEVKDRIEWFNRFDDHHPIYVVEVNTQIAGYGTLSSYRPGRRAMSTIAEISFFLHKQYQGMGIGSLLVDFMINDCNRLGKKTLLAILLDINEKSISLLKKFGFEQWGYFPKVVELDDKTCGQLIYGLSIAEEE